MIVADWGWFWAVWRSAGIGWVGVGVRCLESGGSGAVAVGGPFAKGTEIQPSLYVCGYQHRVAVGGPFAKGTEMKRAGRGPILRIQLQ